MKINEIGKILNIEKIENECPDWHKLQGMSDKECEKKSDCEKCWNIAISNMKS